MTLLKISGFRLDQCRLADRTSKEKVQHNEVMPHSTFKGQTPEEVYSGKGEGVLIDLAKARELARAERLKANREVSCEDCTVKGQK